MTALIIVAIAIAFLWAVKHQGDRILNELLNAELRAIDRDRQAGRQAGVDAGWHGSSVPAFQPLSPGPVTNTGNGSVRWWQR